MSVNKNNSWCTWLFLMWLRGDQRIINGFPGFAHSSCILHWTKIYSETNEDGKIQVGGPLSLWT